MGHCAIRSLVEQFSADVYSSALCIEADYAKRVDEIFKFFRPLQSA